MPYTAKNGVLVWRLKNLKTSPDYLEIQNPKNEHKSLRQKWLVWFKLKLTCFQITIYKSQMTYFKQVCSDLFDISQNWLIWNKFIWS